MNNSHFNKIKPTSAVLFWVPFIMAVLFLTPARVAAASSLKTLPGHVPAVVKRLMAKGILPATNRLNLALGLTLRDSKGLEDFLAQLYDPASPRYRQYLTPEQFASEFGPTESDYAAVRNFARQNNLTVTALHTNRLLLDVSGSVEDIQKAFHITLRTYSHPTQERDFYAPDTEPSVDASLPISDISGLNNYRLAPSQKPAHRLQTVHQCRRENRFRFWRHIHRQRFSRRLLPGANTDRLGSNGWFAGVRWLLCQRHLGLRDDGRVFVRAAPDGLAGWLQRHADDRGR
jgi:hypothetical protein